MFSLPILGQWVLSFALRADTDHVGGRVYGYKNAFGFSDVSQEMDSLQLLPIRVSDLFKNSGLSTKLVLKKSVGHIDRGSVYAQLCNIEKCSQ
jgi:hypothetical protein